MSCQFDSEQNYDEVLGKGLRLSGESREFFIDGRVRDLADRMPAGFRPRRILDFGCGTGETCGALARFFPDADIVGVDVAEKPLELARKAARSDRIRFSRWGGGEALGVFDLCYVNGVFHHIEPGQRNDILRAIRERLAPGAYLSFFENNPWNPGTRMVMRRIEFDRGSIPLSHVSAHELLRGAGFLTPYPTRFLFYFPRILSGLRVFEPALARLPLGAQYHILAVNP